MELVKDWESYDDGWVIEKRKKKKRKKKYL